VNSRNRIKLLSLDEDRKVRERVDHRVPGERHNRGAEQSGPGDHHHAVKDMGRQHVIGGGRGGEEDKGDADRAHRLARMLFGVCRLHGRVGEVQRETVHAEGVVGHDRSPFGGGRA